jgi:phosphatidylserine/phosphatidylglycerophosphate/cardiolipin synthase-like enzyme
MFGKSQFCSRSTYFKTMRPTGNQAFNEYKDDKLTQLVNEKEEFKAVLERLRQAKHRIELDYFIKECNRKAEADGIERA